VTTSSLPPLPPRELPFHREETLTLVSGKAWLDVRHDSGWWYASLRIKESPGSITDLVDGVNGFCDVWHGPHFSRDSAISNGYAFGRHRALAAGTPLARTLHHSAWSYLP
jgi:hypothetical protein